ncbi:hypothetical protein SAMN04489761_1651 [Tenacibaculum sp. MAR_2009_124]|nr:hypothetical protein SAMN04489761_1651 [Tenacibaculum sp. MAR_2009_124]
MVVSNKDNAEKGATMTVFYYLKHKQTYENL